MTSLEISWPLTADACRPLPGRCVIAIDQAPSADGSIVIPESAAHHDTSDTSLTGTILAVGYGPYWEGKKKHRGMEEGDLQIGDKVVFRALLQDLNCKAILTGVARIDGVLEEAAA